MAAISLLATSFWMGRVLIYSEVYDDAKLNILVYVFNYTVLICEIVYFCVDKGEILAAYVTMMVLAIVQGLAVPIEQAILGRTSRYLNDRELRTAMHITCVLSTITTAIVFIVFASLSKTKNFNRALNAPD